jgi:hypothetical protein
MKSMCYKRELLRPNPHRAFNGQQLAKKGTLLDSGHLRLNEDIVRYQGFEVIFMGTAALWGVHPRSRPRYLYPSN